MLDAPVRAWTGSPSRVRRSLIVLVVGIGATVAGVLGCTPAPSAPPTPTATSTVTEAPTGTPTTASATPAPTLTPAPSVAVTPSAAGPTACTPDDLKASHGIVDAAAGARLTQLVLVSAAACAMPALPALNLVDATGVVVAAGRPPQVDTIELVPGAAYLSDVRFANWCEVEPAFPWTLVLRVGPGSVAITGDSFPAEGDLPPCLAATGPELDGTAWAPS